MQHSPMEERDYAEPDPRVQWIVDVELPGWVPAASVNAALDFPDNGGTTLVEVVGWGHDGWFWTNAWGESEFRRVAVVQYLLDGDHPAEVDELVALYQRVAAESARIGGRAKPRSSPEEGAARARRLAELKRECGQPVIVRVDGEEPMEVEEVYALLAPVGFERQKDRLTWRDRTISPRRDRRVMVRRRGTASWTIEFNPALTFEPPKGFEAQQEAVERIAHRFHGRILDGDGQSFDRDATRARVARVATCLAEVGIEAGSHASWLAF